MPPCLMPPKEHQQIIMAIQIQEQIIFHAAASQ
jgi:hypothetical protein